jgi:TolA-binding protein
VISRFAVTTGLSARIKVLSFRNGPGGPSLILFCLALVLTASAVTFDEQRAAITASPATQSEAAILSLLKAGLEEGKPTLAIAEAQQWLRQNQAEDPQLLYYAAHSAELSGDWKSAVAFYKQYLTQADPKSETASDAILATYTLQLNYLGDASGAFAWSRTSGHRLAANPQARKFDRWFLDYAKGRRDHDAVAKRLRACVEAGYAHDLLIAHYEKDFRWLLNHIGEARYDQARFGPEFVADVKVLAAAIPFDDEFKYLLAWYVSVYDYNMARIAGEDVPAPLTEAKALLERFPHHALQVQTDWAGSRTGRHYRDDPKKYWPHEIEAKMALVLTAAEKLTPIDQAALRMSWRERYYDDNTVRPLEVKVVRDYVRANPKLINRRTGMLLLDKPWEQMTPAEARELAPKIAQNPHPHASLIRALAAAGEEKNIDKAIAAVVGPEAWRLPVRFDMHYMGGNSLAKACNASKEKTDAFGRKVGAIGAKIKAEEVKQDATAAQRVAAFKKLWTDYLSPQPKVPAVLERLKAVLVMTPEVLPVALEDTRPEARLLLKEALAKGIRGTDATYTEYAGHIALRVDRYDPAIVRKARHHRYNLLADFKARQPQSFLAHPQEPVLRQIVAEQLKQNRLEHWLVFAWLNAQFPEDNAESIKLAKALFNAPAYKTFPYELRYGLRDWFKRDVVSPAQLALLDAADPARVCKDLIALPKGADAATAIAALDQAIAGIKASPIRMELQGLEQLAGMEMPAFTNAQVLAHIEQITGPMRMFTGSQNVGYRWLDVLKKNPEPGRIHRTAAWMYQQTDRYHRNFAQMMDFAESLEESQPSAASTIAQIALQTIAVHRGHTYWKKETDLPRLKAIRGRAAMKMGLIVIPVQPDEPTYPVYKSQAEWLGGNEDSAWPLVDENWEQLTPAHRELSIPYLMWVLHRIIDIRAEERQEELVKMMLGWANESSNSFTPQEKIELEIAYGDIAVQRGMLPEAHKLFLKTEQNEAYQGLVVRHTATLRRAMTERLSQNYDAALKTLMNLELERIPELWSATRYARGEVFYDMEEYSDASDEVAAILQREPNHAEAKIMEGRLFLKRKKLMEATEVELGSSSDQETLVPGEKLKVTLNDPTLAVSGVGTEIEVVVTATSGDRETFYLRQFGDVKTKFRGEVDTALGAPTPDDRILQLVGDDQVHYAYSEAFRAKMNKLEEKRGGPIGVASDAVLMASARALLSEAEQFAADRLRLEEELAHKMQGARLEQLGAEALAEEMARVRASAEKRIAEARVKPGNPIYVRVTDHDRGRTAKIDELTVSVESSSGDGIARVTLKETETHSGRFEGSIRTSNAQALAFAENTEPGRNPNMVISPKNYAAWRPVPIKDKSKTPKFTVDLNDNVELGELTITAQEPGAQVKKFVVQTAMNSRNWTTVAVFPEYPTAVTNAWHPSVVVMNDTDHHHTRDERSVYDLRELTQHLEQGWISQRYSAGAAGNVAGPSEAMTPEIPGKVEWKRQNNHHNSHVIYRFRGYFHEPAEVRRRFKLELGKYQVPEKTHPSVAHPPQFLLAVDGRPITDMEKMDRLEGEVVLRPGLHRFEIWATGWDCTIGFGRDVNLKAGWAMPTVSNADETDRNVHPAIEMTDCPDSFFDPSTFPAGLLEHRNAPSLIAANEAGTEFKIPFSPNSRARLLRLVFMESEGPVPALNKLTLRSTSNEPILPVPQDYAELNKNDQLEILTGDKVAVRYIDDRFVTRSKEKLERFLHVAFSDAKVEFADIEPRWSSRHQEDRPYYEKLLRFAYDKPLTLAVRDPDMDVSVERDTIEVTLDNGSEKRTVTGTETEPSSGLFKVVVTPVAAATSDADKIHVTSGGTLSATYRDAENVRPGVPFDRLAMIQHAGFETPKISLAHATVTAIDEKELPEARGLTQGFVRRLPWELEDQSAVARKAREVAQGLVIPRSNIETELLPATTPPADGFTAVHGQRLYLELHAPQLALGEASTVKVYVQTDAGRELAALTGTSAESFDIDVPGTIELNGGLEQALHHADTWRATPHLATYVVGRSPRRIDHDRFKLSVPLIVGFLPPHGALTAEERYEQKMTAPAGLVVRPGERIHLGFRYIDSQGKSAWVTATAKAISHPVFDIMQEDNRHRMKQLYVGENLNLRVVDLGADTTDNPDRVEVLVQAKSGGKHKLELTETDPHSGIFRTSYATTYTSTNEVTNVRRQGYPVSYGDTIAARYTDSNGIKTPVHMVTVGKGSDGTITPFTKQYQDDDTAMHTQFALAESYLELAKRHRKLGEEAKALMEFDRAKQLLSNAIGQFFDPSVRAHAEYLLGNLTMEEAETTDDAELQKDRYQAALARFMKVTGSYPDTLYASMAQFKIARTYEALGEPDIAAQEYVKLAYKFPESEHLATAMARLGTHFQRKASVYEKKAAPMLAQVDDKDAQHDGTALQRMAQLEYLKAAQIFGRLQERFPGDDLAPKAGLRSGQTYMRANAHQQAILALKRVIDNEGYDGPTVRSEAMYWAAKSCQKLREQMTAYALYKRLTYDFPESKWAAYARGELSEEAMIRLEEKLEIDRLEQGL